MNAIDSLGTTHALTASQPRAPQPPSHGDKDAPQRQAFDKFIGETFFGQMLHAMRKTQGKPAYFHGGRAEEIFRQQLDQVLGEKLAAATAGQFSGPMYELFTLGRKS